MMAIIFLTGLCWILGGLHLSMWFHPTKGWKVAQWGVLALIWVVYPAILIGAVAVGSIYLIWWLVSGRKKFG
jgi:drug/metabolite transporter superfamily protein YnfA